MALPPSCKRISKIEQAVIGQKTNSTTAEPEHPYFTIYDDAFLDILGPTPTISLAVEQDWPFAHEAGVYIPSQDAVFVTSNRLGNGSSSTIKISKISRNQDGTWISTQIPTNIQMANGGINHGPGILFCAQGSRDTPGGLVHMSPTPPYTTQTLLDNFHGRQFNSLNDVVVHTDGSIWFTDPIYGFEQGFRPEPQLRSQVYRFDPMSGDVRAVADGFGRPNGICFSPDEQTLYVTDTDWIHGDGGTDEGRARAIYAFDIITRSNSPFLANKRLFTTASTGIPDGIKCDLEGNVYSGCGDGLNVWSPGGSLIGKVLCPGGVANFCFTKTGEIVLLNETKFWVVGVSERVQGALLQNMGIEVE